MSLSPETFTPSRVSRLLDGRLCWYSPDGYRVREGDFWCLPVDVTFGDISVSKPLKEAEIVFKDCIEKIRGFGVETRGAVRQGDPSSELLKYLAKHQPFQAVVWGGNETFVRRKRTPVRTHWLERIRDQLDCTLVVPSLKKESTGGVG